MRRLIRSKEPGPTVSAGGKSSAPAGAETPQRLRCLPAKRASAASAAVMPQGAGFSGDRGGLIKRGPRSETLWGVRPLSTGGKWTERPPGGLDTKGEMPPGPPVRLHRGYFLLHTNPLSPVQKEEGLREEHGFFPRRKLRRGPRFIRPPRSPEKPAPCGIAPLSRRWADRARPALRCRNGVSAETPAIKRGGGERM